MNSYNCLLFDLDRTLWDVERNQKEALRLLYTKHRLDRYNRDFEHCFSLYEASNNRLWEAYRDGKVTRETLRNARFEEMLAGIGIDDPELTVRFGDEYVKLAPTFKGLIPHAAEVVATLSLRYPLYIITNGFLETQHIKLSHSGLARYFKGMICSEEAGANKPSPIIFAHALQKAGVTANRAVVIGDDPTTDIRGACNAGIDSIWFNPSGQSSIHPATHQIAALPELLDLL